MLIARNRKAFATIGTLPELKPMAGELRRYLKVATGAALRTRSDGIVAGPGTSSAIDRVPDRIPLTQRIRVL